MMEERRCSNCGAAAMKSETGEIRKEVRVSLVTFSIEEYMPKILRGYGEYTIHVCEQCGKVEVFVKKAPEKPHKTKKHHKARE